MKSELKILLLFVILIFITACGNNLPLSEKVSSYSLLDQDSSKVIFPDFAKGKISVVGYIFTNCPDICPLTTNNMNIIQEKLKKEKIHDVQFVSISFDPVTDKPSVLKKFAKVRSLDLSNWEFLTGEKSTVSKLIKDVGVVAIPSDSTILPNGTKQYYYVHTDRISLMDRDGRIRKNYPVSKIKINEILEDIKSLE